jgi:hypothetical protein
VNPTVETDHPEVCNFVMEYDDDDDDDDDRLHPEFWW